LESFFYRCRKNRILKRILATGVQISLQDGLKTFQLRKICFLFSGLGICNGHKKASPKANASQLSQWGRFAALSRHEAAPCVRVSPMNAGLHDRVGAPLPERRTGRKGARSGLNYCNKGLTDWH
jgi:hypothetical protein